MNFAKLLARTFARILYMLLSKLMGLKSFKQSDPFFVGIRVMKDVPACLGSLHLEWKSFMKAMISVVISQNC